MANLYANVVQAGTPGDLAACFDLVIAQPARLMNLADYGIAVGNPADLVCWISAEPAMAIAEVSQVLTGFKRGAGALYGWQRC